LRQGRFRQAISLFLEILSTHPELPRVRLELARAYFLDRNFERATFHFELVKGGDLPGEVLTRVDQFLDTIRRQKNWTLDFAISPITDTNINFASGGREECIDTAFGTLCRPLRTKASGLGLSVNTTLNYFIRTHDNFGLRATVGFYGQHWDKHGDYNDHSIYLALGPRFLYEKGEISLQPNYRKRWYGGKEYSEETGLRLDARHVTGRLVLDNSIAVASTDYADPYVRSILKGSYVSIRTQPRYILSAKSFIQTGLEFRKEDTKSRAWSNESIRYSLGAYREFSHGLSLMVEGAITKAQYQDLQWYITQDNRIAEVKRKDTTKQLFATLTKTLANHPNMTPMLQYSYTERTSNIWVRSFERHRVNVMVNWRF